MLLFFYLHKSTFRHKLILVKTKLEKIIYKKGYILLNYFLFL